MNIDYAKLLITRGVLFRFYSELAARDVCHGVGWRGLKAHS